MAFTLGTVLRPLALTDSISASLGGSERDRSHLRELTLTDVVCDSGPDGRELFEVNQRHVAYFVVLGG